MVKDAKDSHKKPGRNGNSLPAGGRPKGVPNKTTTQFKEALNHLLEESAPKMIEWLEQVDSPEKRFDILTKMAEYIHPKLARSEVTGKDGGPIKSEVDVRTLPPDEAYKELLK